jgi:hypothetical protein
MTLMGALQLLDQEFVAADAKIHLAPITGARTRLMSIAPVHSMTRPSCATIAGRLIADFERPGRQSYLLAERWSDQIVVDEIRRERISVPEFPGFKALHLTKPQLDMIVRHDQGSWRAALSSVAGVYLISDSVTGRLYVGSATGEGGIWQRWVQYSLTGHGGNKELGMLRPDACSAHG